MTQEKAPEFLDAIGKKTWKQITQQIAVTDSNRTIIASLCEEWSLYLQCVMSIRKNGRIATTERGAIKTHPDLQIRESAHARFCRCAKLLGLGVSTVETSLSDVDPLADFKE